MRWAMFTSLANEHRRSDHGQRLSDQQRGGNDAFVTKFSSTGAPLFTPLTWAAARLITPRRSPSIQRQGLCWWPHVRRLCETAGVLRHDRGRFCRRICQQARLELNGAASLIYSTYLGSTAFDYVLGLDVEASVSHNRRIYRLICLSHDR